MTQRYISFEISAHSQYFFHTLPFTFQRTNLLMPMTRLITSLLLVTAYSGFAQSGLLKESLKVKSNILSKEMEYSIYLPADYETSNRSYPVLYLLHGYSDDETGWTQFGEAHLIADRAIQSGETAPMIIVMPDAGVTWYINSHDGKINYEDYFIKEFIPHIDDTYRTRTTKQYRAIAGLSMGGYGTLIMATKHPQLFSSATPLSAGVFEDEAIVNADDRLWKTVLGDIYGKKELIGKNRLTEHYYKNSILKIIESGNVEELKQVRFYVDCGDDDFLINGNMALHRAMTAKTIPHEFRVRDGVHNWTYWRTALPEVLKFVSESFHQK